MIVLDAHFDLTEYRIHRAAKCYFAVVVVLPQLVNGILAEMEVDWTIRTASSVLFTVAMCIALKRGMQHRRMECQYCHRADLAAIEGINEYGVGKYGVVFRAAHILLAVPSWVARKCRYDADPTDALWKHLLMFPLLLILQFGIAIISLFLVPTAWGGVTLFGGIMMIYVITLTHQRLILWCPQCPSDGGGGGNDGHCDDSPPPPSATTTLLDRLVRT